MTRVVVDPDGDVCLRLPERIRHSPIPRVRYTLAVNGLSGGNSGGAESTTAARDDTVDLIVSSKILATISPVFKTMFYGNFREGIESAAARASSTL
jgi:hypothetical protein